MDRLTFLFLPFFSLLPTGISSVSPSVAALGKTISVIMVLDSETTPSQVQLVSIGGIAGSSVSRTGITAL